MRSHLAIPVDFSMPSKKMVKNLDHFRLDGAQRITLIHVREVGYPVAPAPSHELYYDKLLEETALDLRSAGWEVEIRHEAGRPGSKIVEIAEEVEAELIVLANHGHGAITEVILGSVALDVLERSKIPVFLFSSETIDDPLWERIVHPTDFSKSASKAQGWAADLARDEGIPLVLLHAVDDRFSGNREETKMRKKLEALRDELHSKDVAEVETQIVIGKVKKVIGEAADHYPGALFIMGTLGRGWVKDLMLGGLSRSMARRGTHHVLFVPQS